MTVCEPLPITTGIFIARSLVYLPDTSPSDRKDIVVRILNVSPIPQIIKTHTPICKLTNVVTIRQVKREMLKVGNTRVHRYNLQHLSVTEQQKMKMFLESYEDIFASENKPLRATNLVTHTIDIGDSSPICKAPYCVPFKQQEVLRKEVDEMLKEGSIRPSVSPLSVPVVLVEKKSKDEEKKYRFCIDFDADTNYVAEFLQIMKIAHRNAIETIERNTERVHQVFNQRSSSPNYQVGDRVYLYDPTDKVGISGKLAKRWTGPYRITQQKGVNANIKEIHGRKELKVNRLKPCLATDEVIDQLGNVPLEYRRRQNLQEPIGVYRYNDKVDNQIVLGSIPRHSEPVPITHLTPAGAPTSVDVSKAVPVLSGTSCQDVSHILPGGKAWPVSRDDRVCADRPGGPLIPEPTPTLEIHTTPMSDPPSSRHAGRTPR